MRYRRTGHESGAGDDYDLWNDAHTATLEDYGLPEFDQDGGRTLYHPEALEEYLNSVIQDLEASGWITSAPAEGKPSKLSITAKGRDRLAAGG